MNSDWLADQLDERSVLGHAQIHKGNMKGDDPQIDTAHTPERLDRGGGGNLSFQDTGLCHSYRKSNTHKSGKLSQKYTHKSGEISQKYTHKSGEFLKIIHINPGMPKKLTNN